jgi:hypothetical protein
LAGDLVPATDNTYNLGTLAKRWKSLQLGPGTLWIQDTVTGNQAGITVVNGTLMLDGVENLRLGNIRFTTTGIRSIDPTKNITIGDTNDTGWLQVAHGILFPDNSILTSASGMTGPQGPAGPRGATGEQGPAGPPGSIEGYEETKACMYTGRPNNTPQGTIMVGTCEELHQEGKDIVILLKK